MSDTCYWDKPLKTACNKNTANRWVSLSWWKVTCKDCLAIRDKWLKVLGIKK